MITSDLRISEDTCNDSNTRQYKLYYYIIAKEKEYNTENRRLAFVHFEYSYETQGTNVLGTFMRTHIIYVGILFYCFTRL